MSATSFLRHRRAVAAKYVRDHLEDFPKEITKLLEDFSLTPNDLANLEGNSDVLAIADRIAELKLQEPELDSLEELNTEIVGERAAVHNPEVRADQFEDKLQHPSAETVGVGNMHDGPQAAEDLANVGSQQVVDAGGLVEAAQQAADEDALASHELPAAAPSPKPAADEQTAEDETPTDPEGVNPGPETVVDKQGAAEVLEDQAQERDAAEELAEAALLKLEPQAVRDYAAKLNITLSAGPRSGTPTLVKELLAKVKPAEEPAPKPAAEEGQAND